MKRTQRSLCFPLSCKSTNCEMLHFGRQTRKRNENSTTKFKLPQIKLCQEKSFSLSRGADQGHVPVVLPRWTSNAATALHCGRRCDSLRPANRLAARSSSAVPHCVPATQGIEDLCRRVGNVTTFCRDVRPNGLADAARKRRLSCHPRSCSWC